MKRVPVKKTELEKQLEAEAAEQAAEEAARSEANAEDLPEAEVLSEGSELEDRVEALTGEVEQLKDQLLRARAEFDTYRRRIARDAEKNRLLASEAIVRDLLPVVDHLELALQHSADASEGLGEGVKLVLKQFMDVLARYGVEPIPALGEPFDPNVHEALMRQPSDAYPADAVCQEFQKGYKLGGIVLRPAKVVVSAGNGGDAESQ